MFGEPREIGNINDLRKDRDVITKFLQLGSDILHHTGIEDVKKAKSIAENHIIEQTSVLFSEIKQDMSPTVKKRLQKFISTDLTAMESRARSINSTQDLRMFREFIKGRYQQLVNDFMDQYGMNLDFKELKLMRNYLNDLKI